jgi:lysophospholipase L1-like esterase
MTTQFLMIRFIQIGLALAPSFVAATTGLGQYTHDPAVPEELRIRDGLPNFFAKMAAGGPVRIAYLGGSITAANGWRPKTLAWFRAQFPQAEVVEINAAISGTGSDYGACRIARDVLVRNPDLVFMEHRVNGGGGFEAKSVEGIIRQIWKQHPRTDIGLIYTINEPMLKDLQAGKAPRFGAIMETIANVYRIPSIDLGVEVARRAQAGSLIFRTNTPVAGKLVFSNDGTHPGDAGHDLYRDVIARSMLTLKPVGQYHDHRLPAPMESRCWETAGLLAITNATMSAGWTLVDSGKDAVYRDDFGRTHAMLRGAVKCDRAVEIITVRWRGATLGFSDIPQGSEMEVEVTIDQAPPVIIRRPQTEKIHRYARFFYLPEQAPGEHAAVLRVKTLPAGLSYYAGQVLAVGTVLP